MAITTEFNVEEDAFYLDGLERGLEKGIERSNRQVVEDLLTKFGFSDEQAARATRSSVSFVLQVKKDMKNGINETLG